MSPPFESLLEFEGVNNFFFLSLVDAWGEHNMRFINIYLETRPFLEIREHLQKSQGIVGRGLSDYHNIICIG